MGWDTVPLNPKASLISEPARAAQLFPARPCRQCSGTTKVQRYAALECPACKGAATVQNLPTAEGVTTGSCPECWSDVQRKSTGKKMVPENIPCPGCNGQGNKSRVTDARPSTLAAAKAADWVVIGVEFPAIPMHDVDTKYVGASAELISCMIIRVPTGRIIARVLQSPEYSDAHGLKYGDLLELGPNHILVHTQCSHEEFEKARDGGLFDFTPVVAIPPVPGRNMITRNGSKAVVWTIRTDGTGQYAIGSVAGVDAEWSMDGMERKSRRDFDLVQFAEVVNT